MIIKPDKVEKTDKNWLESVGEIMKMQHTLINLMRSMSTTRISTMEKGWACCGQVKLYTSMGV